MYPSFRLAWRDISQHKLRSLIGIMLIAIPVCVTSISAIGAYTAWLPVREPQLQAIVNYPNQGSLAQDPSASQVQWQENATGQNSELLTADRLQQLLPENELLPVVKITAIAKALPAEETSALPAEENDSATRKNASSVTENNKNSGRNDERGTEQSESESYAFKNALRLNIQQFETTRIPGQLRTVRGGAPKTGEINLDGYAARQLGANVGDRVRLTVAQSQYEVRVSGINISSYSYLGADTLPANTAPESAQNFDTPGWYVIGESPVTWEKVKEINKYGSVVYSTYVQSNPPAASELYPEEVLTPGGGSAGYYIMQANYTIVAVLILLVFTLMISPIFTISAQRMSRTLSLAVMNGAEGKHVRTAVIAHGIIIGLSGGILGAFLGLVESAIWRGSYMLQVPFIVLVTAGVGLIGLLLGLIAAALPAQRAARLSPVQAAAIRASDSFAFPALPRKSSNKALLDVKKNRRRQSYKLFLVLALLGVIVMFAASAINAHTQTAIGNMPYFEILELGIVVGMLLVTVGALGAVPALIDCMAFKLPLQGSMLLAAREAARARHRTTPTIRALTGAIIGATLLISITGIIANEWKEIAANSKVPIGAVMISRYNYDAEDRQSESAASADAIAVLTAELESEFGKAAILDTQTGLGQDGNFWLLSTSFNTTPHQQCYRVQGDIKASNSALESALEAVNCDTAHPQSFPAVRFVIVNSFAAASDFYQLSESERESAQEVWEAGGILVPSSLLAQQSAGKGQAVQEISVIPALESYPDLGNGEIPSITTGKGAHSVPMASISNDALYDVLVPAKVAQKWGFTISTAEERIIIFDQHISPFEARHIENIAEEYHTHLLVSVNQIPMVYAYGTPILLLLAAIGFLVFVAFVMAMSGAEMASDYATLYAIGASPKTLRSLAGTQGAIIAGAAAIIGIPVGLLPVMAIFSSQTIYQINPFTALPWLAFLALAIIAPCFAALGAALTRPRKLSLTRRFE